MNGAWGTLRPCPTSGTRVLDHLLMTCTVVRDESTENLDVDACPLSETSPATHQPGLRTARQMETEVNAERESLAAMRNQVKEKGLGQMMRRWLSGLLMYEDDLERLREADRDLAFELGIAKGARQ